MLELDLGSRCVIQAHAPFGVTRLLQEGSLDPECMKKFQELQQCMTTHPEAFAEFSDFQKGGDAARLADSVK